MPKSLPQRITVESAPKVWTGKTWVRADCYGKPLCRACIGLGKTPKLDDCPKCGGCGWESS